MGGQSEESGRQLRSYLGWLKAIENSYQYRMHATLAPVPALVKDNAS